MVNYISLNEFEVRLERWQILQESKNLPKYFGIFSHFFSLFFFVFYFSLMRNKY